MQEKYHVEQKLTASLHPLQHGPTFSTWQAVQWCGQTPVLSYCSGRVSKSESSSYIAFISEASKIQSKTNGARQHE